MKKLFSVLLKVIKWILIVAVSLVLILLIVRFIGKTINKKTPDGGINEEMYVDVNGQKQWISIYGNNKDNPVMLYLHGGPGFSTSYADWAITRKLADDYTVVSWDQRDCAKTWINDPKGTEITPEVMREDLVVMVDFLLDYFDTDKITFLGMSWGTYYGCDYALTYPEKVECIINLSQCVDEKESALAVKQYLLEQTENNPEDHKLAEEYDPLLFSDMSDEEQALFDSWINCPPEDRGAMLQNNPDLNALVEKTKKQTGIMMVLNEKYLPADETYKDSDVNLVAAVIFNPYYSLSDLYKITQYNADVDFNMQNQNLFFESFSLKDKKEYKVPIYVLQGTDDDLGGVAKNYIDSITAPDKDFRYIDGGHMSTMLQSEKLAEFVKEIARKQK